MKTYLLAPNFTLEPNGPVRIGTVIADPFRPTKPLHSPPSPPATVAHTDLDTSYTRENHRTNNHSIWARFFHTTGTDIGAKNSEDVLTRYTMDSLETIRIKDDPTDEEATELLKVPKIQATVSAGLYGSAPVYMITGIKIAKGFRLISQTMRTHKTQLGASTPITETIGAGADVQSSRTVAAEDVARSGSDVIFAYQLHVIAQKRWWRKQISVDAYAPRSAFLGEDAKITKKEEAAAGFATVEQLLNAAEENEYDYVKSFTAGEEGQLCACVSFAE